MKQSTGETHTIEVQSLPIDNRLVIRFLVIVGLLTAAFVWAYWDTAASLVKTWSRRPVYSHGFFVLPFALWLMWQRMQNAEVKFGKPQFAGLLLLIAAFGLRWFGTTYFYNSLTMISILPAVMGILIVAGGLPACRWSWPAVLVLGFMIPLPYQLETALQGPLRSAGTGATVYVMQSAGLDVVAEGNVIISDEMRIGVEEACSGLSMLLTFLFLSAAVVLAGGRSAWESGIILLSAIPIALISNVLRITVVGALYKFNEPKLAELVHEQAAFLMMPAALGMLWIETVILSRLFVDEVQTPIGVMWLNPGLPTYAMSGDASPSPTFVAESPPAGRDRTENSPSKRRKRHKRNPREEAKSWRAKTVTAPR